jgi:hypothetical protein
VTAHDQGVAHLNGVPALHADQAIAAGLNVRFTRMSHVPLERVTWLWPGYLPLGKVVDLSSDPGLGKSTVTIDLAARVSTGRPMPDGTGGGLPRGVLLLSAEDGLGDTIRPRLEAADADLDRAIALTSATRDGAALVAQAHQAIHDAGDDGMTRDDVSALYDNRLTAPELDDVLASVPGLQVLQAGGSRWFVTKADPRLIADDPEHDRPVVLPRDLRDIEHIITTYDIALVIVDVLMAYLDGKVNSFKDQDVRRVLAHLAGVAARTGACIVFVRHLNKSGGPNPLYRSGGSIGIIGAARAGFIIAPDPDDENRRVLACVKSNLAPMPPALAYVLEQDPARDVARVNWQGTSNHTAADILRDYDDDDDRSTTSEAAAWLEDYLYLNGGAVASSDAKAAGRKAGFSESAIKRARKKLHLTVEESGFPRKTWWKSPVEPQSVHSPESEPTDLTGPTGAQSGQLDQLDQSARHGAALTPLTDEEPPL